MLIHAFLAGADFVGQVSEKQMTEDQNDTVLVMDRACKVIYDTKNNMILQSIRGNIKSPQSDGRAYLDRRSLSYVILDKGGNLYQNWAKATSPLVVA